MKLKANKSNLRRYANELLGSEYTPERAALLEKEALTGFVREPGHVSHSRAQHLKRLDALLGNFGVEGMLLDKNGRDMASECTEYGVVLDIQYSNTGDTYGITLMYVNGTLCIGDWGSLVENLG